MGVPATLLQQHQQQQPPHPQQVQQKQQGRSQIPPTMEREVLSMPLSQLVRISADPKAEAEETAVLTPRRSWELLEQQLLRAARARACFARSSGQEMPRGDRQEQMVAGPCQHDVQQVTAPSTVVPRLPHGGGGPGLVQPSNQPPIQASAPLEQVPHIMRQGQWPMSELEVTVAEFDERAPDSSVAAADSKPFFEREWAAC